MRVEPLSEYIALLSEIIENNLSICSDNECERNYAISGLPRTARPFATSAISLNHEKPIVVLTATAEEATTIHRELREYSEVVSTLARPETIVLFPPWELMPYETGSPHQDVMGDRLQCLSTIASGEAKMIVTSLPAITQYITPPDILSGSIIEIGVGNTIPLNQLVSDLIELGYRQEGLTIVPGTFAIRGGIVDVYVSGEKQPVRIEFFGDEVESIRRFNPSTQMSTSHIKEINVIPTREALTRGVDIESALKRAYAVSDDLGVRMETILASPDYENLEPFIPILYEKTTTLLDYLEDDITLIVCSAEETIRENDELHLIRWQRYESAVSRGDIMPPPSHIYTDIDEILHNKQVRKVVYLEDVKKKGLLKLTLNASKWGVSIKDTKTIDRIAYKTVRDGGSIILATDSEDTDNLINTLNTLLPRSSPYITVIRSGLMGGFYIDDIGLALTSTRQLFGGRTQKKVKTPKKKTPPDIGTPIRSYTQMDINDICVHEDYGIGVFRGLMLIRTGGTLSEYAVLEYANESRIYVPVEDTNKVFKYTGSEVSPALDRPGSRAWERRKKKAQKKAGEVAERLVRIYAERKISKGYAFGEDKPWQYQLEESFEYVETEDQLKAIEEIKKDMEKSVPMDRLVCGDVGFGKTEVAIRASFKAVLDGKQVAVLVPTTILSSQHLTTFRRRLSDFPITVEMVSRLNPPSKNREILNRLALGGVDIIIGTHRLLSKDVRFADLGLVILDEEHRFGVMQKERLKEMTKGVDVISMSATPIPRTLYLALSDIFDISNIGTPPEERQPIYTYIRRFSKDVIRDAIMREIYRGGQVYFIHNRVQTIGGIHAMLEEMLPEVRFRVAHGQMDEIELTRVMTDFYEGRFDCLISSAIVESGIDNPMVNTIIINRADRFGLAQLHQLRGRVGRGGIQAYCYLLIPSSGHISKTAQMRLETVRDTTYLGGGFSLALRDLEIRGAGNILGREQSGHIASVGFETYMKMIADEAQKMLGKLKEHKREVKVSLDINAYIPEMYIPDQKSRLSIYRQLADANKIEEIEYLENLMSDMYGEMPDEVKCLTRVAHIRVLASEARIETITEDDGLITLIGDGISSEKMSGRIEGITDTMIGVKGRAPYLMFKPTVEDNIEKLNTIISVLKHLIEN